MADTAVTIASTRVTPLAEQEQSATGYNVRFRVLSSDIAYGTGSSDTVTMTLGTTPTTWYVEKSIVNISTAFAGTTAMTLIVGTTTTTNAFVTSQSILTAATLNGAGFAQATASKSLVATFTNATGGSPSALTAGQLDIYLRLIDCNKLP